MQTEVDEKYHPRVQIIRAIVAGAVQIVGIIAISLMELVALQEGVDGTLLVPIVATIALLVGVKSQRVMDTLGLNGG